MNNINKINVLLIQKFHANQQRLQDMFAGQNETAVSIETTTDVASALHRLAKGELDGVFCESPFAKNGSLESLHTITKQFPQIPLFVMDSWEENSNNHFYLWDGTPEFQKSTTMDEEMLLRCLIKEKEQKKLKESSQKAELFAISAEQSPVSIVFTDKNGIIEYVNPKLTELTGYSADELLGKNPRIFKSGHTTEAEYEQFWEAIRSGQEWHGEFLNRKKDGTLFWEAAFIAPVKDDAGEITHFVGVKQDISHQKREAARLAQSEKRYRDLFEYASDAIFINDENGRFLTANKIARERLDYSLNELRELTLADIDPIEFSNIQPERKTSLEKEGYAFYETAHVSKNGRVIPTEVTVQQIEYDGQKATLCISRDITKRKETIKAERQSRKFAEAMAETAALINKSLNIEQILKEILINLEKVVFHDSATIMLLENDTAKIVEIKNSKNSLVSHSVKGTRIKIDDFAPLTEMVETQKAVMIPLVTQHTWVNMPAFAQCKSYVAAPICHNGDVLGFITLTSSHAESFSQDDEERLQAFADQTANAITNAQQFEELKKLNTQLEEQVQIRTEQLKYEKELLEAILYNSPDTILFMNLSGEIVMANSIFYETFQMQADAVVGQKLPEILHIQSKDVYENMLGNVITRRRSENLETVVLLNHRDKLNVQFRMTPIQNGSVKGVVCTLRNMTKYKIEQLAKDAFVSNVSHELKTPITSLALNHQLLRKKPLQSEKYLDRLDRETNRLNQMIEDLLFISRLDQNHLLPNIEECDLNQLVTVLVEDRQLTASSANIKLHVKSLADLLPIQIDAGLIEQVLSILINNGIAYNQKGGTVEIRTHQRQKDGMNWCGVSVCDTGQGILPDEQDKIFERFYRGKKAKRNGISGTGLGLAIAQEIVSKLNGWIEVKSEGIPGKETTFEIWLPRLME